MQANEFDDLIKSKFDQEEFAYKPELWQQLSQQLPVAKEKKNRIGIVWWQVSGMAAAVALIVTLVIKWQQPASEIHNPVAKTQAPTTQQHTEVIAMNESRVETKQEIVASKKSNRNNTVAHPIIKHTGHKEVKNAATDIKNTSQNEEYIADAPRSGFSERTDELAKEPVVAEKKKHNTQPGLYDPLLLPEPEKIHSNTSFSFTGGVNYGSQNAGYMVGVTAQRSISRKIYIEGNVGFVNGNAQATSTYKTSSVGASPEPSFHPSSNDGIKSVASETYMTTVSPLNLYYLQVAPVIGYNVYKGLSVGVGADFQRLLLNNESHMVKTEAGTIQYLTKLDVGLTGKTEYQVSKRVKAGILYRNGISNVLKNKMYLDRDYLQVQFKYTFIH